MAFDTILISIVVLIIGAHFIMSASMGFFDVPWLKLITHNSYFGGRNSLLEAISIFFAWCVLSIVFGIFGASLAEPILRIVANKYYQQIPEGYFLLIKDSLVTIIFLFCLNRAKNLNSLRSKFGTISDSAEEDLSRISDMSVITTYFKELQKKDILYKAIFIINIICVTVDLISISMEGFYCYFKKKYGNLLFGCGNLLLIEYGNQSVINFYSEYFCKNGYENKNNTKLIEILKTQIENENDNNKIASYILNYKLKVCGYKNTISYINAYLTSKNQNEFNEVRKNERRDTSKPINILCEKSGECIKGKVINYSVNGSGLFLATTRHDFFKKFKKGNINLIIKEKNCESLLLADVVYFGFSCRKNNIFKGYGIQIKDEHKEKFSEYVMQREKSLLAI